MRRRRMWRSNATVVSATVAGVDPVTAGTVGAVDATYSHGMAGRTGSFRGGDTGDPVYRHNGYLTSRLRPGLPPIALTQLRRGPAAALPETAGNIVSSGVSSVHDHLANLAPRGTRR